MKVLRLLACALLLALTPAAAQTAALDIDGLWAARMRYGPDVRGPLLIERRDGRLFADIAGYRVEAQVAGREVRFELPSGLGAFRGSFAARDQGLSGHWIQQRMMSSGNAMASPVQLRRVSANAWQGEVRPLDDAMTMYLMITTDDAGVTRAYLRNPDRNLGAIVRRGRLRPQQRSDPVSLCAIRRDHGFYPRHA